MRDIVIGQEVLVVDFTPVSLVTGFNSVADLLLVTVNITSVISRNFMGSDVSGSTTQKILNEKMRYCNGCNC
jgi:hypothetical protein